MNRFSVLLLAAALSSAGDVWAEDAACATVKLGDPGWSDIAVTNGIASFLFDGLGYKAQTQTLAVPIIFAGLQKGQVDVFLGNWMPAQQSNYDKFVASGEVDKLAQNLAGTEYTLAVPTYAYEAGVKTFADLDKHADKFGKKLYGIASGSPANESIRQMIAADEFGLGDWKLVESSEQAMLVQVGRAVKRDQFVVFLGWTPHPMNVQYDMQYLKGGEKYFGDSGEVNTLARRLRRAVPQRRQAAKQPDFHPGDGEQHHGSGAEQAGQQRRCDQGLAAGQPAGARWLAGRRDHPRRWRRPGRREGAALN